MIDTGRIDPPLRSPRQDPPADDGSPQLRDSRLSALRIGGTLLTVYICALVAALSFYAPDGYVSLGNYRFLIWQRISLLFLLPVAVCVLLSLLPTGLIRHRMDEYPPDDGTHATGGARRKTASVSSGRSFRLLPADIAALSYAVFLTVSFLLSSDRAESLWGTAGWRMGFLTELLFLFYWFAARCLPVRLSAICTVSAASAGIVVLTAVLDRFGIYLLPFMGNDRSFISTIGNVDWYCGYLALALSLAAGMTCCAGDGTGLLLRIPGIVLLVLSVLSVIQLIAHGTATGWLLIIAELLLVCSFLNGRRTAGRMVMWIARLLLMLLVVSFFVYLSAFRDSWTAAEAVRRLPLAGDRLALLFSEDFGNGRGGIWRISWTLYRELPLRQKLFGIGPDAYASYVYETPRISRLVFAQFGPARLTNAHSELLTLLIDEGVPSAISYLAFLGSSFFMLAKSFYRKRRALTLTALTAIVTLSAVQAVTFRTVVATPFLFLLLGMAASGESATGSVIADSPPHVYAFHPDP